MHLRLKDRKVQAAVKKDAKARKCSCARAAEMALEVHYLMAKTYYPIPTKAKP